MGTGRREKDRYREEGNRWAPGRGKKVGNLKEGNVLAPEGGK